MRRGHESPFSVQSLQMLLNVLIETYLKRIAWSSCIGIYINIHEGSCLCFVVAACRDYHKNSIDFSIYFFPTRATNFLLWGCKTHLCAYSPAKTWTLHCFGIIQYVSWFLSLCSLSSKATNVLLLLGKVAAYALTLTGFFCCQLLPAQGPADPSVCPPSE